MSSKADFIHRVRSIALTAALFVLLQFGQSVAFAHDLLPDSHSPDHTCEICMVVAHLSAANGNGSQLFVVVEMRHVFVAAHQLAFGSRDILRSPARGPPATF